MLTRFVLASLLTSCHLGSAVSPGHAGPTEASAAVGKPAPTFTLPSVDGASISLTDLQGQVVVLEWFNPDCPFVVHAHEPAGPLHQLGSQTHAQDGVVWLAINSGAPGRQGHGADRNRAAAKGWNLTHPILLDESGEVGRAYGAKTTPQMFVIDRGGTLRYAGGLDDAPLGKAPGDAATPFFGNALQQVLDGEPVSVPETKPYGCSVKY